MKDVIKKQLESFRSAADVFDRIYKVIEKIMENVEDDGGEDGERN